jgi:hypothetical protein
MLREQANLISGTNAKKLSVTSKTRILKILVEKQFFSGRKGGGELKANTSEFGYYQKENISSV